MRTAFLMQTICMAVSMVFVSCAAVAQEDVAGKKLTMHAPAMTLENLFAEIQRQVGVELRASSDTRKDVMLLRVAEAPLAEVMKKIAEATGAEWTRESNAYRLIRYESTVRQQAKEEGLLRAPMYKAAIDKMMAAQRSGSTNDSVQNLIGQIKTAQQMAGETQQQGSRGPGGPGGIMSVIAPAFQNVASRSPSTKVIFDIVSRMDPVELASIASDSRVVYSDKPTAMQKRLPANSSQLVAQFVKDQQAFQASIGKSIESEGVQVPNRLMTRMLGVQASAGTQPARTLLVIRRLGSGNSLNISLTVQDANGTVIATGMAFLDLPNPVNGSGPAAETFPLSDDDKALYQALKSSGVLSRVGTTDRFVRMLDLNPQNESQVRSSLSDALRAKLLSPDKHEPLAGLPSSIVENAFPNGNLVAVLPDSLLIGLHVALDQKRLPLNGLSQALQGDHGMKVISDGTYTVVRPAFQVTAREERVDRVAMAKLLGVVSSTGRLSLDQLAAYALNAPAARNQNGIDQIFSTLIDPSVARSSLSRLIRDDGEMIRFYGTLTANQKSALSSSRSVPISTFSPAQIQILKRMVFDSQDGPNVNVQAQPVSQGTQNGRQNNRNRGNRRQSTERTDILSGLPSGTTLTMMTRNSPAVVGIAGNGAQAVLDERDLVRNRLMTDYGLSAQGGRRGGNNGQNQAGTRYDQYLVASQMEMRFIFTLSPNASLTRTLQDEKVTAGAPVSFDQLPSDFRNRVLSQVERARTRVSNPAQRGNRNRTQPRP